MKALVTSGGRGTRLRPITHTRNKHLLPIANKPILHYALEHVAEAGVTEVGIIVPTGETEVSDAIGDGAQWGIKITYIEQDAPKGLAHCVLIAEDFLAGEPFLFYLGDNMVLGGVKRFVEQFEREQCNCLLTIAAVHDPERFGVPEIKDGRIVSIEEKPERPKSQYAVAGIYIYDETILDAAKNIQPSARGELEISEAHQYLIDHGRSVHYAELTGWWKDTGKPADLLEANALVLSAIETRIDGEVDGDSQISGRVIVEKGARVVGSRIRGPAIVGAGTVLEGAYVGPSTSIGANCEIRRAEIEFSMVMDGCRILDLGTRIGESILGYEAQVLAADRKPRSHRLTIGDRSIVEIA